VFASLVELAGKGFCNLDITLSLAASIAPGGTLLLNGLWGGRKNNMFFLLFFLYRFEILKDRLHRGATSTKRGHSRDLLEKNWQKIF